MHELLDTIILQDSKSSIIDKIQQLINNNDILDEVLA